LVIARTVLVVSAGALALLLVLSQQARGVVRRGATALVRIEREDHVFSGVGAILAALVAIVVALGALLAWAFSDVQFG
jgi:hypothetical protein